MLSSRNLTIGSALLISAATLVTGCSTARQPLAETPPPPMTAQADPPRQLSKLPPPQARDVQEAVKRIFKDAAEIDTNQQPSFIVGDFNGDLSEDIAVLLKPAAEKLSELNEEAPTWILRDLAGAKPRSPRLRVAANDKLLAIIHGYEANGWRDQQATQTYLLKNAAGPGMEKYSAQEVVAAYRGRKLPQFQGDVVGHEIGGKLKCIYYAGATYSWYDPKTFDPEPERRVAHMGAGEAKK